MPKSDEVARHRPLRLGVFVIAIAVIAAGIWTFVGRPDSTGVTPAPVVASGETSTLAQPVATETPAAAKPDQPGDAPQSPSPPRTEAAARRRATVPAVPASVEPSPLRASPAVPASVEPPPLPAPPVVPASVEPPSPPVVSSPAPERVTPSSRSPVPATVATIYDAASPDVVPPALLTPIANAPVRTNSSLVPGSAAIEIIVNDDGSVHSVKAATQPTTLSEAIEMVNGLAISKSWRFGPAVRNGQPVKYRLIVPLSTLLTRRGAR